MSDKFVPFCPCCQSYKTDDKHQNNCFLGHAEKRIAELEAKLNTFNFAVQHVTEDGKTKRSFSDSEGWTMIHNDRHADLLIAEEQLNAILQDDGK